MPRLYIANQRKTVLKTIVMFSQQSITRSYAG